MKANILKRIKKEIDQFSNFLKLEKKLVIEFASATAIDEGILSEDALMHKIVFNKRFFKMMNYDFAVIVILHEVYHFAKQGITSKQQVIEMRYDYLWPLMQIFDIEADLVVLEYLKYINRDYSFRDYVRTLHIGGLAFRSSSIRLVKLERFIGSFFSIKQYLITNNRRVYLPKLSLNSLTLVSVCFHNGNFRLDNHELLNGSIDDWKHAFQYANEMHEKEYIDLIDRLTDDFNNLCSVCL